MGVPPADTHLEITRGQELDRELARDLGRVAPARTGRAADYVDDLRDRPTLPEAAERELVRAAQEGDRAARARLVEAYLPLIAAMARVYRTGHVQRTELLQEGVVGLLRALEHFELERGTPFWAYASWWVRQAMQQLVSELTRPVVLSDRALRQLARLKDAHRAAVQRRGRESTCAELAERTGLAREQVDDLLATERAPRSLEEPVSGDGAEIGTFGELLADPLAEGAYEDVLRAIEVEELHSLLAGLSDRERQVLRARYGLDDREQTLREVGDRLGLSGERVRQIEQRALAKLASASAAPSGHPARPHPPSTA